MIIRISGALLTIVGCVACGVILSVYSKKETSSLGEFINILDYMQCELAYKLTPLPELCKQAGFGKIGPVKKLIINLGNELEAQTSNDVYQCMKMILQNNCDVPPLTCTCIEKLGEQLGCFDLNGQLKVLASVRTETMLLREKLITNQDERLKSYKTLSFCIGAAIAILLI